MFECHLDLGSACGGTGRRQGFAAALVALGNLSSADFIALVAPLAALLAVLAVARGTDDTRGRPGGGKDPARPG